MYVAGGTPFTATEGFDDMGGDELGFSFGRVFTNIGKAVKKGVSDVTNEAKRAAKNPLVQAAASVALPAVGGIALVRRGISVAQSLKDSRAGQAVQTVQNVRRKLVAGEDPTTTIAAGVQELAPGSGIARAATRVAKAKQGAEIQAANAAKAAAAAEKKAANLAARRAAKAAEGARIQAENQAKAEAAKVAADQAAADRKARALAKAEEGKKIRAKREADRKAAEAKRLEEAANAAAEAGRAADAARLREQATAAADAGRAAAAVASQPSIYTGPVQSGPVPGDNYAAQAGGTAPASGGLSSIPTPYLALGAVALVGGLYAATSHSGRGRW